MTASVLQLQAKGEQDVYLTGNPTISYYKYANHRHTNFAVETQKLLFNNYVGWGKKSECSILRQGDLVSHMYLEIHVPALSTLVKNTSASWVSDLGYAIIKDIEVEIGGQRMDIQTGEYMYATSQLYVPGGKKDGFNYMVGNFVKPFEQKVLYVPLNFWFNNHHSLALPLISLQMHEVVIKVHLRSFDEVTIGATEEIPLLGMNIITDYIFLDKIERNAFSKNKQEYLISQVQSNLNNSTDKLTYTIDLNLKNNVSELIWLVKRNKKLTDTNFFKYSYGTQNANPIKNVTIRINGNDKIANFSGEYFNLVQPFQHHSNVPANTGINLYSFSLNPESFHPSGSLNFSMIENATLTIELYDDYFSSFQDSSALSVLTQVFALSYNIFMVENGTGTMKYV